MKVVFNNDSTPIEQTPISHPMEFEVMQCPHTRGFFKDGNRKPKIKNVFFLCIVHF